MFASVSRERWGHSLAWGKSGYPGKEVLLEGLGVERNYVWCFIIVVIFMKVLGAKSWGVLRWGWVKSHLSGVGSKQVTKGVSVFMGGGVLTTLDTIKEVLTM